MLCPGPGGEGGRCCDHVPGGEGVVVPRSPGGGEVLCPGPRGGGRCCAQVLGGEGGVVTMSRGGREGGAVTMSRGGGRCCDHVPGSLLPPSQILQNDRRL